MGKKYASDEAERRADKRSGNQQWADEVESELAPLPDDDDYYPYSQWDTAEEKRGK